MEPTKRRPNPSLDAHDSALAALPEEVREQLPLDDRRFRQELERTTEFSDYAAGVVRREARWLSDSWHGSVLEEPFDPDRLGVALGEELAVAADEARVMAILRRHRHRELLAILWRDLAGRAELGATLAALSGLAEMLIDAAVARADADLQSRHGSPRSAAGEIQRPVVLGMGKLGGGELNFSSDVDLLFAYREAGSCDGPRSLSNEEYFARLVRTVVRLLAKRTADGFVYRVDLRLRPFGEAGRPALSFASMEQYYQRDGRDWERYALVKARPVAGDRGAGRELLTALRPFVYRRYLDYAAFDALREMKARIRAEVRRRDMSQDIKLGAGGIREIEFIAQTLQLVRGGGEPSLRDPRLRPVLARLGRLGLLEPDTASALDDAYCFLRTLENRLQQIADRQTHRLPSDPELRRRLPRVLGLPDFSALVGELERRRSVVHEAFEDLFALPETQGTDPWREIWDASAQSDEVEARLAEAGFRDPVCGQRLGQFRAGAGYRALGERARRRVDRLMPRLLETAAADPDPDVALRRALRVVDRIAARTTYVALLCERPPVLVRLVQLCRASPWITDLIARQPALLDELIGRRGPASEGEFREVIETRLGAAEDPENELTELRRVQQSELLAIASQRCTGALEPRAVARRLAGVADAVLAAVHRLASRDLVARHGTLPGESGLAIIGYGTLGGRELNFDSDLDLVFLFRHEADGGAGTATAGSRPIAAEAFFSRLSQRILNALTALMPAGRLYRVDTRLRPNGKAGFLVSSLSAFADYQRTQAWTWELQALSRARWVAGDPAIEAPFAALRRERLRRRRDPRVLAAEVVEMRAKMRAQLDRSDARGFDLKHGRGGKVDIEFITQFARLAWSREHPALADSGGTLDTLASLAQTELLPAAQLAALIEAYETYQRLAQRRALEKRPARVEPGRCAALAGAVIEAWSSLFDE